MEAQDKSRWINISHDNDMFGPLEETDRYYSFGANIEYTFSYKGSDSSSEKQYDWNKYLSIKGSIKGFTPDHLENFPDLSVQRPFLAHSSLTLKKMQHKEDLFYSYSAIIGATGRLINAGKIQNWVHEHISGDKKVRGWDTQVRRKFTFHLSSEWHKTIEEFFRHRILMGSNQSIGNLFTYIEPRITYQYRTKDKGHYLPYQYSGKEKDNFTVQAFLAFRYEFFNAAIKGEFFDQEDNIRDDDVIHELFIAGLELRYDWKALSVFYANYFNTKRIQRNNSHIYGTLGLAFRFDQ